MTAPGQWFLWLALLVLVIPTGAASSSLEPDRRPLDESTACSEVRDASKRLECYDRLASQRENRSSSAIGQRTESERFLVNNVFGLIAYKPNYFMPASYLDSPNEVPFNASSVTGSSNQELDNVEAKFQFSFKAPVARDLFKTDMSLWFGYTQLSLWQMYNKDASHPFRESNYEPELYLVKPMEKELAGSMLNYIVLGLNHQSNGLSDPLSRSWNRLYLATIWGHNRWAISFRPWYRIPPDREEDDNPDIYRYMGYFDLTGIYKANTSQYSLMFRASRDRGHHHITGSFTWSVPVKDRFSLYVELFNGYGETLIDYNHRNRRIGIGILLSDWL